MKPIPPFIPVIHVQSDEQAVEQTKVTFGNGATGIFLIDHRRSHKRLLASYELVRQHFPLEWIGLNFLDLDALDAIKMVPQSADGLWMDSVTGVERQNVRAFNGRYFAGVAFKYQEQPENLAKAANDAAFVFDVVTTSGEATGVPADPAKLAIMRAAIVDAPLALASGVTAANVQAYLPHVSCFLVSTGISRDFHSLDPEKVKELARIIHEYEADHGIHLSTKQYNEWRTKVTRHDRLEFALRRIANGALSPMNLMGAMKVAECALKEE